MFGPTRRELSRQLERERAANRAREAELLDRVMVLAGNPWNLPPAEPAPASDDREEYVGALDRLPGDWEE